MKVLKTIVATAVIVFALTTVAMAGVQRIGIWGDSSSPAVGPAATETHQGGMTLTDDQFARLLHAANGQAAERHTPQADRETTRARVRAHSRQKAGDSASHAQAQHRTQSRNSSSATHDAVTTHDGGGTHHGGGTHDTGTHHDGGTCDE
jgi:hypothetical protein